MTDDITILVRLSGEITIKARNTRLRFTRQLATNIRNALDSAGIKAEVDRQWTRIYVSGTRPEAAEVIARVFGVQSLSVARPFPWSTLDELVELAGVQFEEMVAGKKFAVRTRRMGDPADIPFRSNDVDRLLGSRLFEHSAGVDLSHPEVTAFVDVYPEYAYLYERKLQGKGGLPVGVEGRALALVSGGFDSAVAAWLMLKRGVALDYVFFNLGGAAHREGVLRVMKIVADSWSYGDRPKFHEVDFRPVVAEIQEKSTPRFWQVVLKRLMVRAASLIAAKRRLPALVTGEAVGQVSSQTLQNLAVIAAATETPILQPVISFNKNEIIDLARRIGTYDLSAAVGEYCAILPRRPETHASIARTEREEAEIDFDLLERVVQDREIVDLRSLRADEIGSPELETDEIPKGATVIDLRSRDEYVRWHFPEALLHAFPKALKSYGSFDRKQRFVLYCEYGLKSGHLAELMQEAGLAATHVRGGIRHMKEIASRAAGSEPKAEPVPVPTPVNNE